MSVLPSVRGLKLYEGLTCETENIRLVGGGLTRET